MTKVIEEKDLTRMSLAELVSELRRAAYFSGAVRMGSTFSETPEEDLQEAEDARRYADKIQLHIIENRS